jgi:hypothetical protein
MIADPGRAIAGTSSRATVSIPPDVGSSVTHPHPDTTGTTVASH